MSIKLATFDMQGTLTDRTWSDEFWREFLPRLFAVKRGLTIGESKRALTERFSTYGRYDSRYYSFSYWRGEIDESRSLEALTKELTLAPYFYPPWVPLLKEIGKSVRLAVLSATTGEFINIELGEHRRLFSTTFSTLEDFGIPGKPPIAFTEMLKREGVLPDEVLHIGDDPLFDGENARVVGIDSLVLDPRKGVDAAVGLARQFIESRLW